MKKFLKKVWEWILRMFIYEKAVEERAGGWFKGKVDREPRRVTFPKVVWYRCAFPVPGKYIVKQGGRTREAYVKLFAYTGRTPGIAGVFKWVADFRDNVVMKGVYAWRPAPGNLIKLF
jgi:hypothetical protein